MSFRTLLAIAAAWLSAVAATAQAPSEATFSPEAFRSHVAFLADDWLEGRESGTPGYDIAARYVASQLESLGLRPGAGDSWFQPVELVRYATSGTPRLTIGGRTFTHKTDILMRPSPDQEPLSLEAPLLFAGYGLDLPSRGFDDYRGLDARGRIVVVLNGYPSGTPSDVGAHLNAEKARMAAERGAVGLIIVRRDADAERTPWERLVNYSDSPGTTWVDAQGQPFSSHGLRFVATVDRPVAEALFEGAPQGLSRVLREAARERERPAGFALAATARVDRDPAETTRFTSPNIVGVLPGSDPALADQYVLLMAHLDGLGVSDEAGLEDRIRNGAMDNATGIATLIEVAKQMRRNPPRRPILFAAVTAEEVGLLGSEYLARNPVTDGRVVAVVNLDMPVLTYDFSDVIAFGAEHSTLGPIVERAAARMNVQLAPDPLPHEGLFTRSDHYGFVRVGVPSVFLMTGFAGEGRDRFTQFLREYYHSPRDDLALPFDWDAGARFAQLNYLIAREIADEPEAPLWYSDSFFGDAIAEGQRRAQRPAAPGQAASRSAAPR
ncbi:M28 family metallopeptidase [Sphingosinicella sp. CPCC 101087]|uniref:M28 family metallopeptidase n=1 Tax=Sphingosinicella sp. CPCC 101087 TaxID=2497754 RepID=UPI00101D341F|nr:M28 family metallopeptidase [Sphingosinicella sp. CPCC 101087]